MRIVDMSVYVDNMRASYGTMIMCHMLADTEEELHEMADKIGILRKWHQYPGTYKSHYDISLIKKKLAIENGAIEVTRKEIGKILKKRKGL